MYFVIKPTKVLKSRFVQYSLIAAQGTKLYVKTRYFHLQSLVLASYDELLGRNSFSLSYFWNATVFLEWDTRGTIKLTYESSQFAICPILAVTVFAQKTIDFLSGFFCLSHSLLCFTLSPIALIPVNSVHWFLYNYAQKNKKISHICSVLAYRQNSPFLLQLVHFSNQRRRARFK